MNSTLLFLITFNETFERLLAVWVHGKGKVTEINESQGALVVFVDDLDRCLPSKTVQTLEAIKLFLDKSGCIFLLGADTRIVQAAVETHYKNAGITGESAKDYLEKIVQLRFDLPPIVDDAMKNYLRSQDKTKVDEAMLKRWQTLVAAADANPRRVKNVINDLNLQWFMAVNSGQAEDMNRDDFICWQALMRAAPRAFVDHIKETLKDNERRHSFVMDALKWQQGKHEDRELVKGYFSAYEDKDSKRLREVLKQISFSDKFTPDVLDAMIYLVAPPVALIAEHITTGTPVLGKPSITSAEPEPVVVQLNTARLNVSGHPAKVHIEGKPEQKLVMGGIEFVRVPAGKFVMGSEDESELASEDEKPQHIVDIPYDYWIAKFIITNQQFAEFIKVTGYVTTAEKEGGFSSKLADFVKGIDWKHPIDPNDKWEEKEDHPVVQVSWNDAIAYCRWSSETFKSELDNLFLRLPTEAEWEKASRGPYSNEWPWGNEFDKNKCNSSEGGKIGTTPVGYYSLAGGDSPYGCADMVGNVWEWTHSLFAKYPYRANDGREDEENRSSCVLRGGSFSSDYRGTRCAFRANYSLGYPEGRSDAFGFRVGAFPIISL